MSVLVFSLAFGFVAVTAAAARWRPQVQCRCFGALAESGFGRTTLLRSVVLAVAAGMVAGVGTAPIEYGGTATGLLLALGALFALGCAAAANAIALMRKGAASR